MKLRAWGKALISSLEALGVSPITIAQAEVQSAMVAGTVDGVVTGVYYGYTIGMHNIANHVTYTPLSPGWNGYAIMNAETFDSLPPDIRDIIMQVSDEVASMNNIAVSVELMQTEAILRSAGQEILTFEPAELKKFIEKVEFVQDQWVQEAGSDGAELLKLAKERIAEYRAFKLQ